MTTSMSGMTREGEGRDDTPGRRLHGLDHLGRVAPRHYTLDPPGNMVTDLYCSCGFHLVIKPLCLDPAWLVAQFTKIHSGRGHGPVDVYKWLGLKEKRRKFVLNRIKEGTRLTVWPKRTASGPLTGHKRAINGPQTGHETGHELPYFAPIQLTLCEVSCSFRVIDTPIRRAE